MMEKPLAFTRHARTLGENRYVYAVLARRSKGVSVGVNLNPDKVCNWDCVYCQVDRTTPPSVRDVDLGALRLELEETLRQAATGDLFRMPRFEGISGSLLNLADIAFAGDGEPTSYPLFDEAIRAAIEAKQATGWKHLPIVVLTNATLLDRPAVRRGLDMLAADGGEIWAKLDAGSEDYFRKVDRPHQTLERCVRLISEEARRTPVVIQSLFMKLEGTPPDEVEIEAYIGRLRSILDGGGRIRVVQVTTVARRPPTPAVTMIEDGALDAVAARVRGALPGVPVETFYGLPSRPDYESLLEP